MDTDLSSLPHYIILPIPHLWHKVAVKEITGFNVTAVYICVLWSLFGIVIILLQSMLLQICNVVNLSFDLLLLWWILFFLFQSYHAPKTGFFCGWVFCCCFVLG